MFIIQQKLLYQHKKINIAVSYCLIEYQYLKDQVKYIKKTNSINKIL